MYKIIFLLSTMAIFCNSCKIADLSKTTNLSNEESELIASEKLNEVLENQGFRFMREQNIYQLEVEDHWRGFLGKMVKLWPDAKTQFRFKFNFNTFDGNALFLSGKRKNDEIGVQTWQFYEKIKESSNYKNSDTGTKQNPMEFGIAVLHYFMELPYRMQNAPIKRYYGQQEYNGKMYDLIFTSWETETAHKEHDQYILWVNTESKLVDYCVYTLRANKNPLTRNKYGSIAYLDYQTVDGFKYPTRMPVYLDDGVLKQQNFSKYFHQFSIHQFEFGGFKETDLYPFHNLPKKIDSK